MPPIDRPTFRRLLRRLDEPALERFVADLWAARGWSVDIDVDDGIVARREDPRREELRIRVDPDGGRRPVGSDADLLVVPGGDVDGIGTRVIDGDRLYEIALYGIDRSTLDDVCRSHFGRPAAAAGAALPRSPRRVVAAGTTRLRSDDRVRAVAVGVLAVALVLATGSALVFETDVPGSGGQSVEPVTAVPTTETPTATPVPIEARLPPVTGCPVPPVDVPPAEFRPAVIPHPSPWGLEGWKIESERTLTSFPGPNALPTPIVPEELYIGSYRDPMGDYYRLEIARWTSASQAENVAVRVGTGWDTFVPFGQYTFGVLVYEDDDGGQAIDDQRRVSNTRVLLASIEMPDGGKLGIECAGALGNATSRPAVDGTPEPNGTSDGWAPFLGPE